MSEKTEDTSTRYMVDLGGDDPFNAVKVGNDPNLNPDPNPDPDPNLNPGDVIVDPNLEPDPDPNTGDPEPDPTPDPTPEPEPDPDDNEDVNAYEYLGKQLQADGFLDPDMEIGSDVQGSTVYNAYRDKLKQDLEPKIREEVMSALANEGVTQQDLIMARAIRQGVDVSLLSTAGVYERYSSLPEDADESVKLDAIRQMYRVKNYSDHEANTLIEAAKEDEKLDELYNSSVGYFTEKYNNFIEEENERADQAQAAAKEQNEKSNKLIRTVLSSGEILGEKFDRSQAKELEDAIYNTSEVVEVGGQRYNATKLQKFILEFETNPELKLLMFKKYFYRDKDQDSLKKEVQKEVEKDFLKGYKSSVVKNTKATKNQRIKEQLQQKDTNKKTYVVEL